jgi:hypothetical protein
LNRLLILLHCNYRDFFWIFVRDIAHVFQTLRAKYCEKVDEVFLNPDAAPLKNRFFAGTRHFRLKNEFFFISPDKWDDPRTTNVYLFALLDVS